MNPNIASADKFRGLKSFPDFSVRPRFQGISVCINIDAHTDISPRHSMKPLSMCAQQHLVGVFSNIPPFGSIERPNSTSAFPNVVRLTAWSQTAGDQGQITPGDQNAGPHPQKTCSPVIKTCSLMTKDLQPDDTVDLWVGALSPAESV